MKSRSKYKHAGNPEVLCISLCQIHFFWHNSPQWARASSFMRFLDHTQRRTTVGRTPLDKWSDCRRDLYLAKHNTQAKHPCSRRDSNPQSQQASGRRPLGPAPLHFAHCKISLDCGVSESRSLLTAVGDSPSAHVLYQHLSSHSNVICVGIQDIQCLYLSLSLTHVHTLMHTHAHTHTLFHTRSHIHTHSHTHTHTHTYTISHTHTLTHNWHPPRWKRTKFLRFSELTSNEGRSVCEFRTRKRLTWLRN